MNTGKRRAPARMATVARTERLGPNLLRVTFGGDALTGYPADRAGANLKLLLPHDGQDASSYAASLAGEGPKPLKRTYTVRAFRPDARELDIDFALHDAPGPATRWALAARPGDTLAITEPGVPKLVDPVADWYVLAGDMSALPAIEANLNVLRADAVGHVVLEVVAEADRRVLAAPSGMAFHWIPNPHPASGDRPLVDAVRALGWPSGTPSVWIAGETGAVRALRGWLIEDRQLAASHRYTSGYWQRGHDEDSHQRIKRSVPMD